MKIIYTLLSTAALFAVPVGAQAQDATTNGALPESMRIQQDVTQQNTTNPSGTASTGSSSTTTTEAPGNSGGPVERNRIDPAAPSPQRLQIDDGVGTAVRQNPDVNNPHPGAAGQSYNTILRGAPSNSGVSSGTSSGSTGIGSSTGAGASSAPSAGGASSGSR